MSLINSISAPPTLAAPACTMAQILIVDDDEEVLVNMERVLEDQGYATATANSCGEAFASLSGRSFDLLVLDDHLSSKDSIEIVAELHGSELMPPFVVVTYYWRPSVGEQARLWRLGVSAVISKFAHEELAQTVRKMLEF